jgi:hypothetical protein
MLCGVSCCVTLLKKTRFSRNGTGVKNACYVSLWIFGLRRSGFSSPTCTHNTPHTNFYSSCSSTPWMIMVFLDHCRLFWEFVHPLRWNQGVICGRFVSILHPVKIPVPKIRICLTLVVLVFVNDAKSSVLLHFLAMTRTRPCLLWQSRQRLSLRCPQSSADFFFLCFLSISSCLLHVGL